MYAKRNARGQDWNWLMLLGEMDFGIGMLTGANVSEGSDTALRNAARRGTSRLQRADWPARTEESVVPVSSRTPDLSICLWFDGAARAAAEYYVAIFPDSEITSVTMLQDGSGDGRGALALVDFVVAGRRFQALDGGPQFPHSEAVSVVVPCEDQAEADAYWDALIAGGGTPGHCGWLKDPFGVSWQVVPMPLMELLGDPDPVRAARAHAAMLTQSRLDLAAMRAAMDADD